MKAYVCSVGEKTTDICISQLRRYGFEVVHLSQIEPWHEKYKRFIKMASRNPEDCVRVDADVIVNKRFLLEKVREDIKNRKDCYMLQWQVYDLYKNFIHSGQPVFYAANVFPIIKSNINKINELRPESSIWKLAEINNLTRTVETVVGMHGFFQDQETFTRAHQNKMLRGQLDDYDFTLASRLRNL